MTIFISVAAFNERFLLHTVRDAVTKAANPADLVFAVIDQHPENRAAELKTAVSPRKLRYVQINPAESRGVCWARSLAFSLYQDEDYLLQIDSHMLFEPGWDVELINQVKFLEERSAKPIISVYPYGFEFENDQPVVKVKAGTQNTLVLRPHPDTKLSADNATLRFRAEQRNTRKHVLGCHVAGGFLFTGGQFVNQVPYDPFLYFHGEEQSLAVRAFTKGWDIFHPPTIPVYHLYKTPNTDHATHHWHTNWEKLRDFNWEHLRSMSRERNMDLLYERRDLGVYGLGNQRTLVDYAKISGIDYPAMRINESFEVSLD